MRYKHRHLAKVGGIVGVELVSGSGHPGRLVALVLGVVADDAFTLSAVGPQRLRLALEVVVDDGVGGVEDRLCAAVVLVEDHRGDVGERLLEVDDVAEVGAAKFVHALIRVTHHAHVAVAVGEEEHHLVLGLVGVLVLVDEDVLEALAVVLENVGMLAEQLDGVGEQVVEVHRPGLEEAGLVLGVHVGVFAVEDVLRPTLCLLGVDEFVLPEADDAVDAARGEPLRIEPEVADDVAGEAIGVGCVVDRELAGVAEQLAVRSQDAHACGVEGRHPHRLHDRADECSDTLAHLGRRLVGERDRQDLRRMHAGVDQVGDAMREHPGLARTGAGDHQERAGLVDDGVELVGIEALGER